MISASRRRDEGGDKFQYFYRGKIIFYENNINMAEARAGGGPKEPCTPTKPVFLSPSAKNTCLVSQKVVKDLREKVNLFMHTNITSSRQLLEKVLF